MRVADIMERDVVTLDMAEHLDVADDIMRLGRIRHLPVVAGTHVVGVISQRDLFRAATSSLLDLRHRGQHEWLAALRACDVMATDVVTIGPRASVRDAVELMLRRRVGCLPVVDGSRLVGLVSETECLSYLERLLALADSRAELPQLGE